MYSRALQETAEKVFEVAERPSKNGMGPVMVVDTLRSALKI